MAMSSWTPKKAKPQFGLYGHAGPAGAVATCEKVVVSVPARVFDTL
jgi:hypothetical protein